MLVPTSRPLQRVLCFRSSATFAGPERYLLELGRTLPQFGFELALLALYRRSPISLEVHPLVARARDIGLPAEQWLDSGPLSIQAVFQLVNRLRTGRYALLHCQDYKTDLIGGLAVQLARVPRVATVHLHPQTTWRLRAYRLLDLVVLRLFDRVIAVSGALRQELLAAGLPAGRVVTVQNGLDVVGFAESPGSLDEPRRTQEEGPVVATFGRLDPQKGQRDFLLAAQQVSEARPDTRFQMIGDGPSRAELEQLVTTLGLDRAVKFAGHQSAVATWLEQSDVVVLASLREGLPYVLLEALALARPVVATAVGGVPEVMTEGDTGLLVPPHNSERLAQAILWMLNHPAEAAEMGQRGRERVLREFSIERMARETAAVYREALESR
jgi:glycosyltransferase involved in cell wall biosynthesis